MIISDVKLLVNVFSYISSSWGNINEIKAAKFELLIDRTSSIHMNERLHDLAFLNIFVEIMS